MSLKKIIPHTGSDTNKLFRNSFVFYPEICWFYFFKHFDVTRVKTIGNSACIESGVSGLSDFATGLVKSVFNLPDGQVMFFEEFE